MSRTPTTAFGPRHPGWRKPGRLRGAARSAAILVLLAIVGSTLAGAAVGSAPGATASGARPLVAGATGGASTRAGPTIVNYTTTTLYYSSSVDGWNLSYEETRPVPFNASRTYPLAIELHGLTGETVPVWGGLPNYVVPTTAQAAVNAGMILIDPCTRTGSGWYIDSNYTGPQEQDILDALAHEQSVRHIGSVYLFGVSMGSIGTLELGLDHPGLFHGLGAIASFTDFFEMYDFLNHSAYAWVTPYMLLAAGGHHPASSAYARGIFLHLSSLRFHPQNVSGLRLYVANGAEDVLSSNNLTVWPYQQENNTLLNRTCLVVRSLHEPANCTLPLATLSALYPTRYSYRYIFEPNGPHDYYLLNATDMFAYFLGQRSPGTYWGTWPVPQPRAPPQPLLVIATLPTSCGTVSVGNLTLTTGETVPIPPGAYAFAATPCGHRTVAVVHASGGVVYRPRAGTVSITSSGALVVRFS